FKLNHMLGPLLGGIGAYRLSRRIGASTWASMAGAIAYAGCGYVISVPGSNLPYAIGVGSVPIAVDAVLGFVEAPSVGRYAWAGAAVALIAYAGEPQSVLIAGLLSAAWVLAIAKSVRGAARNIGLAACCAALASPAACGEGECWSRARSCSRSPRREWRSASIASSSAHSPPRTHSVSPRSSPVPPACCSRSPLRSGPRSHSPAPGAEPSV